jgi:hypothetical protein
MSISEKNLQPVIFTIVKGVWNDGLCATSEPSSPQEFNIPTFRIASYSSSLLHLFMAHHQWATQMSEVWELDDFYSGERIQII